MLCFKSEFTMLQVILYHLVVNHKLQVSLSSEFNYVTILYKLCNNSPCGEVSDIANYPVMCSSTNKLPCREFSFVTSAAESSVI